MSLEGIIEAARQYSETLQKKHEDERSDWMLERDQLLAEIEKLRKITAKDQRTISQIQTQFEMILPKNISVNTDSNLNFKSGRNVIDTPTASLTTGIHSLRVGEAFEDEIFSDFFLSPETENITGSINKPKISFESGTSSSGGINGKPKRKYDTYKQESTSLIVSNNKGRLSLPTDHNSTKPDQNSPKTDQNLSKPEQIPSETYQLTSKAFPTSSSATRRIPRPSISSTRDDSKYVEVVRNKAERACLPGFSCTECSAYYNELQRQGIILDDAAKTDMVQLICVFYVYIHVCCNIYVFINIIFFMYYLYLFCYDCNTHILT